MAIKGSKLYPLTSITLTAPGIRQQVTTEDRIVQSLVFQADVDNAGVVYVGDSEVSSTKAIQVQPGEFLSVNAELMRGMPEEFVLSDFGNKVNVLYIARR
jgi:hypothetical protein